MRLKSLPIRATLAVVLLVMASGCFRGWGKPRNPFNQSDGEPGEVAVNVENQNFNDATLYVVRGGGERLRLGSVTGKSEADFTVRWDFTLTIEFQISLIGGGGCRTRPLSVSGGENVWVRIPANIAAAECLVGT